MCMNRKDTKNITMKWKSPLKKTILSWQVPSPAEVVTLTRQSLDHLSILRLSWHCRTAEKE